jgi:hypothetical protein
MTSQSLSILSLNHTTTRLMLKKGRAQRGEKKTLMLLE